MTPRVACGGRGRGRREADRIPTVNRIQNHMGGQGSLPIMQLDLLLALDRTPPSLGANVELVFDRPEAIPRRGTGASAYAASRRHSPRTAWRISMMENATLRARTLSVASGAGICIASRPTSAPLLASLVSGPRSPERSASLAL
jgi:hypothetical protein|uniref:Uncharacterized protein n=1 Tax=Zea mays TaxID=4577 RepID=C0PNZ3_MAIZE|nr:unknown [Zea mays]